MNTEQQDPESWTKPVKIVCPECNSIQDAIIEGAWPWDIYVHHCTNCKYIIMESEWNEFKAKTPEELLRPRIKVIADFWNNPFKVGDVIQFIRNEEIMNMVCEKIGMDWISDFYPCDDEGVQVTYYLKEFIKFPHLFRKLEWWEERKEEDMPEYVKVGYGGGAWQGKVGKAKFEWINTNVEVSFSDIYTNRFHRSDTIPATESEYNEYIQSLKK